jgi:hypothetical protein
MNKTHNERKASGLCPGCKASPEPGKIYCSQCSAKGSQRTKLARKRRQQSGLCLCGSIPKEGETRCQGCRDRVKARVRQRKSNGKCTKCGRPAAKGITRCPKCQEVNRVETTIRDRNNRDKVIGHYGGCCVKCGEICQRFLTVDHINGGGTQHRKNLKKYGTSFYRWLINQGFPEWFQLLCYNCNCKIHRIESTKLITLRLRRNRMKVIEAYGGKCTCCGISDERLLTLDHPNGVLLHRRQLGGVQKLYRWLIREGFPSGYRLLCWNCNSGRSANGGTCPHQVTQPRSSESDPTSKSLQGIETNCLQAL